MPDDTHGVASLRGSDTTPDAFPFDPAPLDKFDRMVFDKAAVTAELASQLRDQTVDSAGFSRRLREVRDLMWEVTEDAPLVGDAAARDQMLVSLATATLDLVHAVHAPHHISVLVTVPQLDLADMFEVAVRHLDDTQMLLAVASEVRYKSGHSLALYAHPEPRVRRVAQLDTLLAGTPAYDQIPQQLARWEALDDQAAALADTLAAEWTESSASFLDVAERFAAQRSPVAR